MSYCHEAMTKARIVHFNKVPTPKRARLGPFSGDALFLQPSLDDISSVLCFPFLQCSVITTFGFDHFTGVRILVHLELAWFACACRLVRDLTSGRCLWVQQIDDVLQAEAIVLKQLA